MRITVHQPEHLPWPGFFHKMSLADKYIVQDNVQFRKNYFQNRNKIYCPNKGSLLLTVPLKMKGYTDSEIKDMRISNDDGGKWRTKNWRIIENSYRKHPHFDLYKEELKEITLKEHEMLVDYNMSYINFFREKLNIQTPMVMASTLEVEGSRSELLLDISKKTEADVYLSGPSGKDYLEMNLFNDAGIGVDFHEYKAPEYDGVGFEPYFSTLDILMNAGPDSMDVINSGAPS